MIAILISAALMGQTGAFDTGQKIRHEANLMIMGMQGVDYETANVLNGSNYTPEQAKAIAVQRRREAVAQITREMDAAAKKSRDGVKQLVKDWSTLNVMLDKIAEGKMTFPDDQVETARGMIRRSMAIAEKYSAEKMAVRNVRVAAKTHVKKAESALAVLEKASPAQKKAP